MDGSANCEVTVGSGVDDVRSMTWFDPWDRKGTVTSPAEQQAAEDVPVLQLTNFAVTPRIGFGLVRVGETQTRKLLLHNPEQFPVTVAVEKVPRAKGFSVDFGEVEVQAGEDTVVSVQWTPGEACNSRALLVLKLDDAYRLHVILYGRAVVPVAGKQKRAKKRTRPREAVKQGSAPVSGSDRKSRAVSDTEAENTPPVSSHQPNICDSPQIKLGSSEKLKLAKNIVNRSGKTHQDRHVINNCSTDATATVPPGTTVTVPGTTATVPPGTTATVPGTTATVPGTTATVPGTTATVPGTTATVPGTTATVPGTTATVPGTTATVPGTTATVPDPANSSSVQKTKRILQPSTVTKRKQNFGKSSDGVRIKAAKKELFGTSTSLSAQLQHQAVPQQPSNVHAGPSACNLVKSDKNSHSQDMPMGPGSGKPFVFRSAVSKNKGTPANSVPQKVSMKKGVAQTKKSQPVKARSTQGETSGGTARCQPKVAKSKLCLVKTSNKQQSVPALHYMPYVSKNMYYDERWMQKQERAFIQWLNFILIPNTMEPQLCQNVTVPGRMPAVSTDQQLRMREYAVLCNLNSVRRAACLLFQSEPVARVLQRVEEEVETGRLRVRDDRHLHADQGIRQQILDMLLSYNPVWLRVGLETIFGEVLPLQHYGDVAGLSRFVLNRVLGNPDIAQQFSHPTVPHMYKTGYAAALAKFTLKKFLTLVFFMDTAKLTRLIDHDPCLFCINANIKSNKELLLSFSREYLSGEGDVTRHLSFLGLTVTHQQTALMEMDYTVHNLATDLRDGLRLIRAVELLTRNWTLSSKLRAPAVSRLQKIHNTKLALDALQQAGVALDAGLQGKKIEARDIVDGRQEKTLALLWKLIFHFQVCMEVEHLQLQKEVTLLRRELQLRRGTDVWLEMYGPTPGSAGTTDHTGLLLQLCQAVCAFYNIRVDNFSVSFSDGRVLCLLVHHYLPELLPLEEIYMDTTQSYITNHRQAGTGTGEGPETDKDRLKELLAHEKNNFRLVNQKVLELGTIPPLLCVADMSNTIPDEKVVMTAVSYLCARIINLSQKVRAVRTIQAAWRKYHPKPAVREWTESVKRATIRLQAAVRGTLVRRSLQRQHKSATTIQTAVRGWTARQHYLKQHKGAIILQQHVRAHLARKHAQARYQHVRRATIRLQAAVRGMHVRRRQKQMQMAATRIQACWRGHQQSVKYKAIKLAATIIQQHFKSFKVMQEKQHKYRSLRSATIQLQAAVRGMLVRKLLQRQHKSATTIQTAVRRWTARQQFLKQRQAAIMLQDHVRAHLARKHAQARYQHVRRATIRLQAAVRGMHVRRRQKQMQIAATRIQACWRGHQQSVKYKAIKLAATIIQQHFKSFKVMQEKQHKYRSLRSATIQLQAAVRGMLVRKLLQRQHKSATTIQTAVRRWTARQQFLKQRQAAIMLQDHVRAHLARKHAQARYQHVRRATIRLQAAVRGMHVRRRQKQMQIAATRIQACWRGHQQSVKYKAIKLAATIIQQYFKSFKVMQEKQHKYRSLRSATIQLQAAVRGMLLRKMLQRQHKSATTIQTAVREWTARQQFLKQRKGAIILQQHVRAHLARKHAQARYQHVRRATIRLQAAVRGTHVRRRQKQMQIAATRIQACWRGHQQSVKYKAIKLSATIIQQHFKSFKVMQEKQHKYKSLRSATIQLQAAVRGMLLRKMLQRQHKSATTIQTAVRGWTARQQFLKQRKGAIILQQHVRAHLARRHAQARYQHVRRATIRLQAAVRGTHVRRRQKQMQIAATRIQACWRGHQQSVKYKAIKLSATIIQQHFKSFKVMQEKQHKYRSLRSATIQLQAAVRGMLLRKMLQRQHKSATIIQTAVRGWTARQQYLKQRQAAIMLQQHVRAHLARRHDQARYQHVRRATIRLQAAVRGMHVRRRQKQMQMAATRIQASWRGHQQSVKYKAIKLAATIIQQHFKSFKVMQEKQHKYRSLRSATIQLQAVVRGMLVRRSLQRQHKSATTIQTAVRGWTARQQFLKQRQATIILQQHVRAHLVRKQAQMKYQLVRWATIRLQAAVRGALVRRSLQRQHKSATTIQTAVRGWTARQQYLKQRQAAIILQQRVRAHLVRKQAQARYQHVRRATIRLQAAVRGMHVRRRQKQMQMAATRIQACWRGHQQSVKYKAIKLAATIIQQHFKSFKVMQEKQHMYRSLRSATICLQAAVRGMLLCKLLQRQHKSATTIQTAVRGWTARQQYLKQRQAAIMLQDHVRAHLARKHAQARYQHVRRATIRLQAAVRGTLVRRSLQRQHKSATTIQTAVRGWTARQQYLKQRQAAIMLQDHVRAHLARKHAQARYQHVRRATIRLQAAVRGMHVRQRQKQMQMAATRIQACWRGHQQSVKYKAIKLAATIIQQHFKSFKVMQEKQHMYRCLRSATIQLQAAVRGMLLRKMLQRQHKSATTIQTAVRGWTARQQYLKQRQAAIILQQHVRAHLACKQAQARYQHVRRATIRLQAAVRGMLVRRSLQRQHKSATTIQTAVRGWTARQQYLKQRQGAIMLQQHVRAHLARKQAQARYQHVRRATIRLQAAVRGTHVRRRQKQMQIAATRIQACWRGHQQSVKYKAIKLAATIIQQHFKSFKVMQEKQHKYRSLRSATKQLQAAVRGMLVRKMLQRQHKSATIIQTAVRGWTARQQYLKQRQAAIILQQHVRAHLARKHAQARYQHVRRATIQLQAGIRGFLARQQLIKWTHASTVIQASFRCFLQRRHYLSTRAAVCRLQAGFRGWTARRTFQQVKLQHRAAVVIQSTYRGFAARRFLQQWRAEQQRRLLHFSTAAYYHLAAMRLQRAYRRYLVWQKAKQQLKALIIIQASIRAWLQRKHFLQLRRVVCKLQAAVRCHQKQRLTAAVVLQSYVRMYLAKKRAIRRRKAVIALQATWRGYHTRKNIKNKRIRIAHQKIMAAKRAATEDKKLCNMTATALNLLLKYKHLSTILDALRSLEVVTRLSSVCCDRLVQGGAVQVIYTLIQSCNRSLPCQEIIKYSISILLNLAKNPDTVAAAVVQEGGVETLVSLMAIYREKDDVIFGQTLEQKDPYALEDGGNAAVIHNDTGSFEHAISDSEAAEFVPPGKEEDFHEQKQTENRKSGGQKKESDSPGPDGPSDQASLDPRERQHA
ncbi:hypothetical protein Bbelb_384840 [Branchiostoma belcheri]|nr:hypothetical protein Bbelb_384840 [Branchiostoma belcheri]